MGFPFHEKRLRVTTLGGVVQEIDGVVYDCQIKDQKGKIHRFTAHGLDQVSSKFHKEVGQPVYSP